MSGSRSNPARRPSPSRVAGRGDGNDNLLDAWAAHDHHSYHDFSRDEAAEIRAALLEWYRIHRRRLPWRGDPPPYDGSTAGVCAAAGSRGGGGSRRRSKNQPTLSRFFAAKPNTLHSGEQGSVQEGRKEEEEVRNKAGSSNKSRSFEATPNLHPGEEGAGSVQEEKKEEEEGRNEARSSNNSEVAFPVTAYGVWVSEIMLQQTRVEAVIVSCPLEKSLLHDIPTSEI